jgi:hypothetical protein
MSTEQSTGANAQGSITASDTPAQLAANAAADARAVSRAIAQACESAAASAAENGPDRMYGPGGTTASIALRYHDVLMNKVRLAKTSAIKASADSDTTTMTENNVNIGSTTQSARSMSNDEIAASNFICDYFMDDVGIGLRETCGAEEGFLISAIKQIRGVTKLEWAQALYLEQGYQQRCHRFFEQTPDSMIEIVTREAIELAEHRLQIADPNSPQSVKLRRMLLALEPVATIN